MELANPAVELGLVHGLRRVERTSDESDAVRLQATRRDLVANVSHELSYTPSNLAAVFAPCSQRLPRRVHVVCRGVTLRDAPTTKSNTRQVLRLVPEGLRL